MAHCRVPMVPREVPSAPYAWATYATAMVSGWTSMPIKSGRDCDRVALRVERGCGGSMRHWLWSAHPCDSGGQPPAIGSHYVSASFHDGMAVTEARGKHPTALPASGKEVMMQLSSCPRQRWALPGVLVSLVLLCASAAAAQVPSIEGTSQLLSRTLPDGTVLKPPEIMGLFT